MSDSQTPQDNPAPAVPPVSAREYVADAPAPATVDDPAPVEGPSAPSAQRQANASRRAVWAAVAALCVAGGAIASVLGAHAIARDDATTARQASQQSSAALASTVKLAIQREEDLRIGASTYFAGNSKTTPAEFDRWAHWARTLRHFPELEQLGVVTLVHGSELATFSARASGHATPPAAADATTSTRAATPSIKVTPAGTRPFYCLTLAGLARHPAESPPAGRDYCAKGTGLLLARDSGLTRSTVVSVGRATALEMITPVYRGNQPPATLGARMGAFAGWLRQVFVPAVLLEAALRNHSADAVRISYSSGAARVVYTGGLPQAAAPSTTIDLHDGWTVQGFGTPVPAGTLSDGNALALLIVGCALSALLGLLVFVLGAGRPPAPARRPYACRRRRSATRPSLPPRTSTTPSPGCPTAR